MHFEEVPCTVPLNITERKLFTLSVAELIEVAQKCSPSTPAAPCPENALITEHVSQDKNNHEDSARPYVQDNHVSPDSVNEPPKSPCIAVTSPQHAAVVSQASNSCCQSPVTVRDNLCHVETTGSPQSFQASEDSDKLREGTRVDQSANERSAGKDNSICKHSPWQEIPHSGSLGTPVLQLVHRSLGGVDQGRTSRVSSLPQHVQRTHGEVNGPSNAQAEKQSISRDGSAQGQGCKQDATWPITCSGKSSHQKTEEEIHSDSEWSAL